MKQAVVTIKYDEEKLNAVKQYMGKKDADFDAELKEVLGKMYEKYVPQAVHIRNKKSNIKILKIIRRNICICSRSFQSNHANAFVCFCKIQNNIINFLF